MLPTIWSKLSPVAQGRLLVLLAAVLWSSSGAFVKTSSLPGISIAMNRCVAAGSLLYMLCIYRGVRLTWDRRMFAMTASFSGMNYFFIASMTYTTAANTIFLQYTAPAWIFIASLLWLREPMATADRNALVGAMIGIGVLIAGEWSPSQHWGITLGLLSGVTYAGVAITMRLLREHDSLWLASLNHLAAGATLLVWMTGSWLLGGADGSEIFPRKASDMAVLALFGTCQMAIPYVLFGFGLQRIPAQEAALITLAEPLLNPVWTYLAVGEVPSTPTLVGGAILLGTLAFRYRPTLKKDTIGGPVSCS